MPRKKKTSVKKKVVKKKTTKKVSAKAKVNRKTSLSRQGFADVNRKVGSGRPPGTITKATEEIRARLVELNCDPLEWAVKFLEGTETPQAHPFLQYINKYIGMLRNAEYTIRSFTKNPPSEASLNRLTKTISDMEAQAKSMLGPGTWLDPKTRARIATDLINYLYPKQQAIVHTSDSVKSNTPVDQITDQALVSIAINILEKSDGEKELEKLKRAVECVNEDL